MPSFRLFRKACAACACTFLLILVSCGGGSSSAPEVPAAPQVQLGFAPTQVVSGQPSTLTWSSTNATACTASGSWSDPQPTSGVLAIRPSAAGALTYRLDCTGPGGTAGASAVLAVLAPPAPPGGNVMPVVLDRGPAGDSFNMPFVSVTVCSPGTTSCRTVDRVLLDTASVGLRIVAPALDLATSLPAVTNAANLPVAECGQFVSGFTWGSVRRADVKLGGATAAGIPIQLIADPSPVYAATPIGCSSIGFDQGTAAALGANGILGVSMFTRDCSTRCTNSTAPRVYYACTPTGCASTALPLESQVANPVVFLAGNSNGLTLTLPQVPIGGVTRLGGTLTFGIGTQANNQLAGATVLPTDSKGNFTTVYKGTAYGSAFIDSGSNGIFFEDPAIPACGDFYCPVAPLQLTAVNASPAGQSVTVGFTIDNINLVANRVSAMNAGGPLGAARSFDWGVPFFFGRTVFLAIEGAQTSGGVGPYWAY
ncbi:MAG: hypothetical protein JWQ33_2302 [Ramlibacter sp.]|nr:hypothetical protein [Ramlibacter sp.]